MAQGEEPHIEVRLEVNQVPYRSAAWRELWRQIFEVIAEELTRTDTDASLRAGIEAGAGGNATEVPTSSSIPREEGGRMAVITSCVPRREVVEGEFSDALFAASFADLLSGYAAPVYSDPSRFFENTHPARQLTDGVRTIFGHLKDQTAGGICVRLSTGFGGGKSHALMTLWHLAKLDRDAGIGAEILPPAARPDEVTVVGVDASVAGIPNFALNTTPEDETVTTHSLWGQLAFSLAGKEGLLAIGAADSPAAHPNAEEFRRLFPKGPVLILLDELVIYMARLGEVEQNNLLGFINMLAGICTSRPQTALVITDPASQSVYASETERLRAETAAQDLGDISGRRATDIDPIGDESAPVIIRRLFKSVDPDAAHEAALSYHRMYERLAGDALVPAEFARDRYREEIEACYPFHPRFLQTARDRLSSIPEFNRSRGTLRLFARVVRSVYRDESPVDLISAAEVDWENEGIVNELLQRLNRQGFSGAVNTDLGQHALELDSSTRGTHTRVASALLLESLTLDSNAGFEDVPHLTAAIIRPSEAGHEVAEAMERLASVCWYTYRRDAGRGYQFRVEPNVNQMIAQRIQQVPEVDARSRVRTEAQTYFQGPLFQLRAWPQTPAQVPDQGRLQLALCDAVDVARDVASRSPESDGDSEMPRRFRNAIVAVAPTSELDSAVSLARRLIAAQQIRDEYKSGGDAHRVRDQVEPIVNLLQRELSIEARRAFSNVVLADRQVRQMEEQYLVPKDQPLDGGATRGQERLREFLEAKQLMYGVEQRLDVDLFMQQVFPGTTPSVQNPGATSAKAVHERVLSAQGLRVVRDDGFTRRTILEAVYANRLVLRLPTGDAFDSTGAVTGLEGLRQRTDGRRPPVAFALDDQTLVAPPNQPVAQDWLRISEALPPEGATPEGKGSGGPTPPERVTPSRTQSWEEAITWSETRPLRTLTLRASDPQMAATLAGLAQPIGADSLALEVLSMGTAKTGGGRFRFHVEGVALTHPTNPLNVAATIFNSLADEGRQYSATVTLRFNGQVRQGVASALRRAADTAAPGVTVEAEFAPRDEAK